MTTKALDSAARESILGEVTAEFRTGVAAYIAPAVAAVKAVKTIVTPREPASEGLHSRHRSSVHRSKTK